MWQQTQYLTGAIVSIPLLPILAIQGKRVRAKVPSLPEADGPFEGQVGKGENPIRLLTLGESTIAGVGVDNHQEGITGKMAEALQTRTGRSVQWQVLARSGYTAKTVLRKLVPQIPKTPFDLIVIGLGGNDTFTLNSPKNWRKDFIGLIKAIRQNHPNSKLVIANMPPVGEFPAFPRLMQLVLGNLVRLHGRAIEDFPQLFDNLYYIDEEIRLKDWEGKIVGKKTKVDFFSDGVHPSPLTYEIWGQEIAKYIIEQKILD